MSKKAESSEVVKVRILSDVAAGRINEVVVLSEKEAAVAVAEGWGDSDPASVAYAESLKQGG